MSTLERHPIQDGRDIPIADRVRLLECKLAQLWDQVWWMSLPPERRAGYEAEGFTAPIERFYEDR